MQHAVFGGGCFWCMEPVFNILGVTQVLPGYMGGHKPNPTYEQVCSGTSGHIEVVQISFQQPCQYLDLLDIFWRNIDPEDGGGQFADRGQQYKPCIFFHDEGQKQQAEDSIHKLESSGKFGRIAVELYPAVEFYKAESFHCEYHKKNPEAYQRYKQGSGREAYLKKTWSQD